MYKRDFSSCSDETDETHFVFLLTHARLSKLILEVMVAGVMYGASAVS